MPTENQAQTFINLLKDALEKDRLERTEALALQGKAHARRFLKRRRPDINQVMAFAGPPDCVQMMATRDNDHRRF